MRLPDGSLASTTEENAGIFAAHFKKLYGRTPTSDASEENAGIFAAHFEKLYGRTPTSDAS